MTCKLLPAERRNILFTARGERQVDNGASVTEKGGKTQNASLDVSHEARTWLSLLRVTLTAGAGCIQGWAALRLVS